MKMNKIREKAKTLGILSPKMEKNELIHAIQITEGNTPCFGRAKNGDCPYTDCCFRKDCLN
jgi:hypothetical protein